MTLSGVIALLLFIGNYLSVRRKGRVFLAAFDPILTGFPGLDQALDSIRLGDNVV